jgi:hypothetical protein
MVYLQAKNESAELIARVQVGCKILVYNQAGIRDRPLQVSASGYSVQRRVESGSTLISNTAAMAKLPGLRLSWE